MRFRIGCTALAFLLFTILIAGQFLPCSEHDISGAHDSATSRIGIGVGNFSLENITIASFPTSEPGVDSSAPIALNGSSEGDFRERVSAGTDDDGSFLFMASQIVLIGTAMIAVYKNRDQITHATLTTRARRGR